MYTLCPQSIFTLTQKTACQKDRFQNRAEEEKSVSKSNKRQWKSQCWIFCPTLKWPIDIHLKKFYLLLATKQLMPLESLHSPNSKRLLKETVKFKVQWQNIKLNGSGFKGQINCHLQKKWQWIGKKKKASKNDPTLGGTRQFTSLTLGLQGWIIRTDVPGKITLVVQDLSMMRQ